MFGLSELAVILIVVIAVLAAKKLPELARSAGKSARILKAEARAMKEERASTGEQTVAGEGAAPRVIPGEALAPSNDTAPPTPPQSPQPGHPASEPPQARD
ncbi:twin-arginine translocase TatA/TatE family subunit [Streptomyces sp. NBC_01017]|uniref:twin-arginine translocase TatA/TatE family subunit n=1 Tax=Streptomyces sp. NBC_01017 TaxID=2903721 RepID=UPI0038708210|nr:twin-arginine translocase TatA/TatE family subunit [Streptomyces sp. NBC_01017]